MFFSRHITTIYITHGKIRSAVFSTKGRIIKEIKTYDWNDDDLQTALRDIAARGPSVVRLVFGEEFSYVTTLTSDKGDRDSVLGKAREIIPEELTSNWDFKKNRGAGNSSQIIAIKPQILDFFVENLKKVGFKIEVIEPQSVALARLVPAAGMFMFIAKDEKVLMTLVRNGIVVATYVSERKEKTAILERFILSAHKKYKEVIETVFVDEQQSSNEKIFLANGLKSEIFNLEPLYAVAIKKHIKGEDSTVLNIKPEKFVSNKKIKQINSGMTSREKILTFVFVGLFLLSAFFVGFKYRQNLTGKKLISKSITQIAVVKNEVISQPEKTQLTVEDSGQAEIAPEQVKTQVRVVVNNGTATRGLAKTMAEKISKISGVTVISIGNTENDFTKTTIVDVSGNNAKFLADIIKAIGGEVGSLPIGETKPEADILVIVGN